MQPGRSILPNARAATRIGVEGQATYGAGLGAATNTVPVKLTGEGHFAGELFEPAVYRRSVPKLFKYLREIGSTL